MRFFLFASVMIITSFIIRKITGSMDAAIIGMLVAILYNQRSQSMYERLSYVECPYCQTYMVYTANYPWRSWYCPECGSTIEEQWQGSVRDQQILFKKVLRQH